MHIPAKLLVPGDGCVLQVLVIGVSQYQHHCNGELQHQDQSNQDVFGPVAEAVAAEGEEQDHDEDQQDGAGDEEEESLLLHLLVVALCGVEGVELVLD